jgi:histidinol phosphatase-like enzyme
MGEGRTIAVDLDGTLNLYRGWRGEDVFDDVRPGAKEFMQALRDAGYRAVVHTTRDASGAERWLRANEIPFDAVTNVKLPALVYLDDRGMTFEGSFDGLVERIAAFLPHWMRGYGS